VVRFFGFTNIAAAIRSRNNRAVIQICVCWKVQPIRLIKTADKPWRWRKRSRSSFAQRWIALEGDVAAYRD
jgi:hypothetical protein